MLLIDPNVVPIVGIVAVFGALAVSARAVVRPIIEAVMRSRELKAGAGANPARLEAQDRRIADLEAELGAVKQELERLSAVEDFYAQLQAGPQSTGGRLPPPTGGTSPV